MGNLEHRCAILFNIKGIPRSRAKARGLAAAAIVPVPASMGNRVGAR
jgi:hypothetical protein